MVDLPDLPKIKKQTEFAPPPPPETEVRTMRTDLESISASGGLSLQAEEVASLISSEEKKSPIKKPSSGMLSLVLIGGVVLLAAGLVGFLFFYILSGSVPSLDLIGLRGEEAEVKEDINYEPLPEVYSSVKYKSFFKLDTEDIVPIAVPREAASSASDLKTFRQRLLGALAQIKGRNAFVEVVPQDEEDLAYAWGEFLELNDIDLLPKQVWQDVFEPGFNLFIYRDSKGSWPGYVLELKPDESPNVRRATVKMLESRKDDISKLFIETPTGGRGFEDGVVVNTVTRQEQFESPSGATFIYGWFSGKYLIISTSFNGMEAAINLLGRR